MRCTVSHSPPFPVESELKSVVYVLLILGVGLNSAIYAAAKETTIGEQALQLVQTARKYHYAPRPVNDAFSHDVFCLYLSMLDPAGAIFTRDLVKRLSRFDAQIDDQIQRKQTAFLDTVTIRYIQQLKRVEAILKKLESQEFDFFRNDTLRFGGYNEFDKTENLQQKWEQLLRFRVLWTFHNRRDSSETIALPGKKELSRLIKEVVERERCKIQLKLATPGGVKRHTGELYLKAIASAFDPHTVYMSSVEKERFESALSKYAGSFGMNIDLNEIGEVEVEELVPGGPAWYSNMINEGDVLLEARGSDGTVAGFRCVTLDEVEKTLSAFDGERVEFTVRKKNGKEVTVVLQKEYLDVEDNIIKSFILDGDRKIGYLYLPSFYADFTYSQYTSKGCANDLARELIRLKRDSIQGLIVDIRSNGGGSMHEALKTAGIFIDKGTLCIAHTRNEKPRLIKDEARGKIYAGPLVVLVNSYSASASELFAGVLQDYHRAVIVGSTTFGKGSIQVILPVDAGKYDSLEQYKGTPSGYVKVTNGAFYRVTGDSHQKKGVHPDILLPDLFAGTLPGEASYKGALELDSIKKKVYYYPVSPPPIEQLKEASAQRLRKKHGFAYVKKLRPLIPKLNEQYCVPLNAGVFAKNAALLAHSDDSLAEKNEVFTTGLATSSGRGKTDIDESEYEDRMKDIQEDSYIIEAYTILMDLSTCTDKGGK